LGVGVCLTKFEQALLLFLGKKWGFEVGIPVLSAALGCANVFANDEDA
jgi:hypothetical protein